MEGKEKTPSQDYAAGLATKCNNSFGNLLAQGKYPKVYVLEARFSCQGHDSTSFLEKVIFSKI
jgi:hypothetical protein